MSPPPDDAPPAAARLLKGGAVVFLVLGAGIAAWCVDAWIRYPQARARQFGLQAPLWPAFLAFVVLATGIGVLLLWTAARRVEEGDGVFAQDRWRRPGDRQGEHSPLSSSPDTSGPDDRDPKAPNSS